MARNWPSFDVVNKALLPPPSSLWVSLWLSLLFFFFSLNGCFLSFPLPPLLFSVETGSPVTQTGHRSHNGAHLATLKIPRSPAWGNSQRSPRIPVSQVSMESIPRDQGDAGRHLWVSQILVTFVIYLQTSSNAWRRIL